jgi:hypothetical protein
LAASSPPTEKETRGKQNKSRGQPTVGFFALPALFLIDPFWGRYDGADHGDEHDAQRHQAPVPTSEDRSRGELKADEGSRGDQGKSHMPGQPFPRSHGLFQILHMILYRHEFIPPEHWRQIEIVFDHF